jgi:hypothetical protein
MTAGGGESEGGSGLPNVVGDVAKIADSGVMKDLLGRSFRAIGDYYGEKVEDHYKYKKLKTQAQEKNLQDHATRLAEVLGDSPAIEPFQIVKIERWIKIAANIPIDDAERAAIFEAAFADIISTKGSSDYQEVAEQLSSSTARLLLDAPTQHTVAPEETDRRGFEHLKSLGLAGTPPRQVSNRILAGVIGAFVGLLFLAGLTRYAANLFPHFPVFLATEFIVEGVVASAIVVGFGISFISKRYFLTDFGKSLQRSAKRFYPRQTSQHRRPFRAAIPYWIMWSGLSALLVCGLPFALQTYLPGQLRINVPLRPIIITSPPGPSGLPGQPPPVSDPDPPKEKQQPPLTAEDVQTLIGVWNSVDAQMEDMVGLSKQGKSLVKDWPQRLSENSALIQEQLTKMRDSVEQRRVSLSTLYNIYGRLPNVGHELAEAARDGVFQNLSRSLDNFAREIQRIRSSPPATNTETKLKPYATSLDGALDAMTKWASTTRDFAKLQSDELSGQK